ncbi:PIG-L deacetylase family protein [Bradyrhizobium retamae]|uniref:GlcNAc-PI de-N-acetylase n=1 Tax=Bradyrhizobium retamae TaxID=1300035 RepID=A0A0R3N542_9BRAD|nr:PIG-L family deacetylase [Bradyrhizobium retamae]KRR27607.1 hypothetical protein CQ13_04270 [Bradyrhizobium retamae]
MIKPARRCSTGLGDPERPRIAADKVAIIVAHPDDETIGCGAQLQRLDNVTVIIVTNGAPRDGGDAKAHSHASVDGYAAARIRELCSAMALADVPASRIIELGFFDQAAALHLPDLTRSIYSLINGPQHQCRADACVRRRLSRR